MASNSRETRLWIGGSSRLAHTYWNAFPDCNWIFLGKGSPTLWIQDAGNTYVDCDLVELAYTASKQPEDHLLLLENIMNQLSPVSDGISNEISQVVVSIAPSLVTHRSNGAALNYNLDMVKGLGILLDAVTQKHRPNLIVHISSIAAIGHTDSQPLQSVSADDPPSHALHQPYDRFKRASEECLEELCTKKSIRFTHLRTGGMFAEDESCMHCIILSLQSLGPYVPTLIDYNSCHNVAKLIHLVLNYGENKTLRPVYYYTRCLSSHPAPYGEWLLSFRRAYGLNDWLPLIVPMFLVDWCILRPWNWSVVVLRLISIWTGLPMVPYLESINYMMQMTFVEQTFDMDPVSEDFPELKEASMEACFSRRRALLSNDGKPKTL